MSTRRRTADGQGEAAAPHLGRGSEVSVQARESPEARSLSSAATEAPARHHRQPSDEGGGVRVAEGVEYGGLRSDADPD